MNNRHSLIGRRKVLRNAMTPAEAIFWNRIKSKQVLNVKFRRQHSLLNFIVDFYAPTLKLVVEIDGGIHDDPVEKSNDEIRENLLLDVGITIIRFTNDEVYNQTESVIVELEHVIKSLLDT